MPIRVHIHRTGSAAGAISVHHEPNWLARIFGARERDYEAQWAGATWVDESTGRQVSWAAHKAIERALTKRAVERRFEGLVGR